MKKKKVMASLVLSAMMIGTLGTSVSASTWAPDGTPGISSVGGQGGTSGMGTIQRERHEGLFLVAVPTSARQYRFYADPTGNTIQEANETFQFQREDQTFSEKTPSLKDYTDDSISEADKVKAKYTITHGDENFSNIVAVYNAGSKNVTVNVSAVMSIANNSNGVSVTNDGYLGVDVVSTVVDASTRANWDTYTLQKSDFWNWKIGQTSPSKEDVTAHGGAVQKTEEDERTTWQIKLPGTATADWINTVDMYTPSGKKYSQDNAVSLEQFNASVTDENKLTEFKYPVALFALKGWTDKEEDAFWDKDVVARLEVKWYITDDSSDEPYIEEAITISDLENGNKVPVSLGSGDKAMSTITSVKWVVGANQALDGVAFTQDLMASGQVTYAPKSATAGNLVFDQMALRTLNIYEKLNGATIEVTFAKPGKEDVTKTFVLWVF